MRLKIVQAGERVLRQKCREVTPDEIGSTSLLQLIDLMRDTMRDAPGVGLAGPQVGLGLRLAVIEDREQNPQQERQPIPFHVLINPKLTLLPGKPVEFFEGCLSVVGYSGLVPRARSVTVDCLNERGEPVHIEASGWYARILQHEIDHLDGALYVDRMYTRSFMTTENFVRNWKSKTIAEAREALGI